MQFQTNRMSHSQDISQKRNFGTKLGLNGPNLGPKIFFSTTLDTMPAYHNMQNLENLMTQTQESDQKPQILANVGLICANLGQFFFSKIGLRHFFDLKNLRNPMISFREKLVTNGRTDGRTNGSEFIGPTSKVGASKNREGIFFAKTNV